MKCIRLLTVVLAAVLSASALSAQSTGLTAHFGYSPGTLKVDSENFNYTGIRFGISSAQLASTSVPLYVDYGLNFNYAWDSDDGYKTNYFSAAVPVNLGYQIDVEGSSLSFSPYGGISGRINILAETKGDGETYNYFDGDDSWRCKRLQLGVQLGLKIIVGGKYIIGYEFSPNVTEFMDDVKTTFNTFYVGIKL